MSDGIGNDQDAQYSDDGQKIAFRYGWQGQSSVLYVMNADGTDVTQISDANGYATNLAWSADSQLIAYQSDVDGDNDIYVFELSTGFTRLLTDNTIEDYAPTWFCNAPVIVFTSDVTGDPNLFRVNALPMSAPAIIVDEEAEQLTFDEADDQYPLDSPAEENASHGMLSN